MFSKTILSLIASAMLFTGSVAAAEPVRIIFETDMGNDVDVKALLRLATLYNVPTAINRSSADFLISSPLFEDDGYVPVVKDYKAYVERGLKAGGAPFYRSCDSGAGTVPLTSKSPQRRAIESSVSNSSGMSSDVTSFRRVGLKSGSPLK